MSEMSVCAAEIETRQSMLRVWLAISAVWVAFWLVVAGIVLLSIDAGNPFAEEMGAFALIVMSPPVALLTVGFVARSIFEALTRKPVRRTVITR